MKWERIQISLSLAVSILCLVIPAAGVGQPRSERNALSMVGRTIATLEGYYPDVEKVYGTSAEETALSCIRTTLPWFGFADVVTEFAVDQDSTVGQITLVFEDQPGYLAVVEAVNGAFGAGAMGECASNAPSRRYAHWLREGFLFSLQDYEDYLEIYITRKQLDVQNIVGEKVRVQEFCSIDVGGNDVILLAEKEHKQSIYTSRWFLKTGAHETFLLKSESANGYEPEMVPFNKNAVLITASTGGSGGIVNGVVADIRGNMLFDSEEYAIPYFKGKFVDNYKAEVVIEDQTYVVDLRSEKEFYHSSGVYDSRSGKLLEDVELWGGGFDRIEKVVLLDGAFGLKCHQTMRGVANVDRLEGVTILFENEKNEFVLKDVHLDSTEK